VTLGMNNWLLALVSEALATQIDDDIQIFSENDPTSIFL